MKLKRIMSFILCFALLCGMVFVGPTALASVPETLVSVRIEGVSSTVFYNKAVHFGHNSVYDFLLDIFNQNAIEYQAKDGYISKIGGDEASMFGGWDGWVYYINGIDPGISMAEALLNSGDSLLLCYGDPFGENPTLLPQITVAQALDNGHAVFKLTAPVTTFDENWQPKVSYVNVADVDAVIEGKTYKSDINGEIRVHIDNLPNKTAAVSISKYDVSGKPLVIDFAPDFTVALAVNRIGFTDIVGSPWYINFVADLVERGGIDGYSDGTFKPNKNVTKAEFVKILAASTESFNIETVTYQPYFTDVAEKGWHSRYITWAVENGIIEKGGAFAPDSQLSRQEMALMLWLYSQNILKIQLPATGEAPAFADDAKIGLEYKEAVYHLQKAEVLSGKGQGMFDPMGTATRAEASKVISIVLGF